MGLLMLGRQKYTKQNHIVPELSAFEVELVTAKLKVTNHQVLIRSQQN